MNTGSLPFPLGPSMKMFLYYGTWVEFDHQEKQTQDLCITLCSKPTALKRVMKMEMSAIC